MPKFAQDLEEEVQQKSWSKQLALKTDQFAKYFGTVLCHNKSLAVATIFPPFRLLPHPLD